MRTSPCPARLGLTTIEIVVALLVLGTVLQAALTVHIATARAVSRAASHRRLASGAASIADSLGLLRCNVGGGGRSTADGHVTWTVRHHPLVATADLVVVPVAGRAWRLEAAIPC